MKADIARDAIKRAAQSLFAARGVDAVSVREILTAAGQRRSIQLGLPTAVGDGRAGASPADDFRGSMKVRIAE